MYDILNITASDSITSANYPWRQVSTVVTASGIEIRSNKAPAAFMDLIKTKMKIGQISMANGLSNDLYSNGSLPNQIVGIQGVISDDGTGTVGNISTTGNAFWLNSFSDASVLGGSFTPVSATNIEALMQNLWLKTERGIDKTDLIIMSADYFTFYQNSQSSLKRYAPEDDAQGGFIAMKYQSADVFHDTSDSGIPAAHAYFLNTDYLGLTVQEDANMTIMSESQSHNQDAMVTPILWQGNLICSNRSRQGCIVA